jgi:hypothetical protein
MPFRRIVREKLKLSADFTVENPALMQNNQLACFTVYVYM